MAIYSDTPLTRQTQANPAAAADWTFTVPAKTRFLLIGVEATFVADANVATRTADLIVTDATPNELARIPGTQSITAGQTRLHGWLAGATSASIAAGNIVNTMCAVGFMLGPGYTVKTSTTSKQVGDQWSSIILSGYLYETA